MSADFLYANAPLVEVLAEVRWALEQADAELGAGVDPYYSIFREDFLEESSNEGFAEIEALVPVGVPAELFPGQVQYRIRSEQDKWPLVQIGPGILTANIVPPYQGWSEFQAFLITALIRLERTYPKRGHGLRVSSLRLAYIDGFSEAHGLGNYSKFAKEMLGIYSPLSEKFEEGYVADQDGYIFITDAQWANIRPEASRGRLKLSPGTVGGERRAILELNCETAYSESPSFSVEAAATWFDEAHSAIREQFHDVVSDSLLEAFGEKREISQ